jgi:signal recognition particle subunit SRP54
MLTLIEKAEEVFEKDQAEDAANKLLEGDFTLEDFLDQMQQVKKMGPLGGIMKMLPGIPKEVRNADIDDRELARVEGMIYSMTVAERRKPDLIDQSRKERIAAGSGMSVTDVAALLTQFREMQKLMKRMGGIGSKKTNKKGRHAKGAKGKGKGAGSRVTAKGTRGHIPKLDLERELQGLPDLRKQGLPGVGQLPPAGPGATPGRRG